MSKFCVKPLLWHWLGYTLAPAHLLQFQTVIVTGHQVLLFYFSLILCLQFKQYLYIYSKDARSLKTMSDYQNIMGVWHMVVMMDIQISCKSL